MKTRDKILSTALELFNTHGYQQVGVREIARELEISPGNLSYHFSKKEDLLFSLLVRLRDANSTIYTEFTQAEPTNARFLRLMENIFHSQFKYRGVFIGNQFVQKVLESSDQFNYAANVERRKEAFRQIFISLNHQEHLQLSAEDIEFLVSFITLFARFWLSEAFLLQKQRREQEVITYYLRLLSRQLSLFATEKGLQSIEAYWSNDSKS